MAEQRIRGHLLLGQEHAGVLVDQVLGDAGDQRKGPIGVFQSEDSSSRGDLGAFGTDLSFFHGRSNVSDNGMIGGSVGG